ncbi:MAG TPA: cytochrome P450 [Candidatus Limnocylindrales bacterium]|nr:cytochrome P450 [Candidatus Limnocylindrales bacterium]
MAAIPRDSALAAVRHMARNPYTFISERARVVGADVFEVALPFQKIICMTGAAACELFYDHRRFLRQGAAPGRIQKTLFGQGGVQGLDDEPHRHRKEMFLGLLAPEAVSALTAEFERCWQKEVATWKSQDSITLYHEMQRILTRAVCAWAGVPLPEDEVEARTRELTALFDKAGAVGPKHWWARLARRKSDAWAASIIDKARREGDGGDTIVARIASHRELDGQLLPPRIAGVELLNILRPTVAISVYLTFVALALYEHPKCRLRIAAGEHDLVESFVQEVRRFYPFFPAVGARVRDGFEWQGMTFPRGRRVMLDLYGIQHDPRLWQEPQRFDGERFLDVQPDIFRFVPQGGGDAHGGHRCAGEQVTVELMKTATRLLARNLSYEVPDQDLSIDYSRLPALPRSGFRIRRVRVTTTGMGMPPRKDEAILRRVG